MPRGLHPPVKDRNFRTIREMYRHALCVLCSTGNHLLHSRADRKCYNHVSKEPFDFTCACEVRP